MYAAQHQSHRIRSAHARARIPSRRIVIVANRTPVVHGTKLERAGGLVHAVLPGLSVTGGAWIGWSGHAPEHLGATTTQLDGIDYTTFDLSPEEITGYYEGFSNSTLWPLLHGLDDRAQYAPRDYSQYRNVARKFAREVSGQLRAGDLVWVHDYQLIPVGEELRDAGWNGAIGYFHHVPVPDATAWAAMPHGDALARALADYDLIGTQTAADARRLAAIVGPGGPRVAPYPVAIDASDVRELAQKAGCVIPSELIADRLLLIGVDRLDYTKGLVPRLEAFEQLLARRPDLRGHVLFLQFAAASREGLEEYQRERASVAAIAKRINTRWDPPHVVISYENHPRAVAVAALRDADICVTTPLADGMNLVAKEFAALHDEQHPGVLVLSVHCGAAHELHEALLVDGGDPLSVSAALEHAIDMAPHERAGRSSALRRRVDARSAHDWFRDFTDDLEQAAGSRRRRALRVSSGAVPII
jgi:trehalose 6-phosphate synthase